MIAKLEFFIKTWYNNYILALETTNDASDVIRNVLLYRNDYLYVKGDYILYLNMYILTTNKVFIIFFITNSFGVVIRKPLIPNLCIKI